MPIKSSQAERPRHSIERLMATAERLLQQATCSLPDIPLPSARRARDLVLAGLLGASPTAWAETPAAQSGGEAAPVETDAATEAESLDDAVNRLRVAFADPQLMNLERNKKGTIEGVSAERLALAQEVVKNFPLKDALYFIADESGISPEDVVKQNRLAIIGLYSPDSLDKLYAGERTKLQQTGKQEELAYVDKTMNKLKNNSGMYVSSIDALYINVGQLDDRHVLNDEEFQAAIYQTIIHEWLHGFETGVDGILTEEYTANDGNIIEGLTDILTEKFLKKLPKYQADKKRDSNGYRYTAQPVAEAILTLGGSKDVLADFVMGRYNHIGELVDTAVGEPVWQKMRTAELPLPPGNDAQALVPLLTLSSSLGSERTAQLFQTMNGTESYHTVVAVNRPDLNGIIVRKEDATLNLNYAQNGLIVERNNEGRYTAVTLSGVELMTPTPDQPITAKPVDAQWNHTDWSLPISTWSYTDDELVDFVVSGIARSQP